MAPYARNQRAGYIDKMKSWETPELLNLDETQWENFVKKMESMRQYLAAPGKDNGRNLTPHLRSKNQKFV